MIFDALFEVFMWLFDFIIPFLELLPEPPETMTNLVNWLVEFLQSGITCVNYFVDLNYMSGCLVVWLVIASVDKGYHIVMWVLRKIPFLGIE